MAVKFNEIKNEEGQAIFEMIIFVPLFIFLFTIIYNVGSAINVSINQQKVVRRYFYYLSKGNSYLPLQINVDRFLNSGNFSVMGMAFTGYRQRPLDGGQDTAPIATCMKFSSFLTGNSSEECEDPIDDSEEPMATSFIRIYSGYGVCGETYGRVEAPHRHYVAVYAETGSTPDLRSTLNGCAMLP